MFVTFGKKKPKQELTLEEIERFFHASNGFSWIDLTGGEVFLRSDFIELVEIVIRNSPDLYYLHFPTNGFDTSLILSSLEKIVSSQKAKYPKIVISVSLDGPPSLHDRLRGVPGAWKAGLDTFIQLKKIGGLQTYIGFTLSRFNVGHLSEMRREITNHYPGFSVDDLHINLAHNSSNYYANPTVDLQLSPRETDALYATLDDILSDKKSLNGPFQFFEKAYLTTAKQYLTKKKTPFKCQALLASCFMDPYGNIFPCTIWDKMIGQVKDHDYSIRNILNIDQAKAARQLICQKKCPDCWTPCEAYQRMLGSLGQTVFSREK